MIAACEEATTASAPAEQTIRAAANSLPSVAHPTPVQPKDRTQRALCLDDIVAFTTHVVNRRVTERDNKWLASGGDQKLGRTARGHRPPRRNGRGARRLLHPAPGLARQDQTRDDRSARGRSVRSRRRRIVGAARGSADRRGRRGTDDGRARSAARGAPGRRRARGDAGRGGGRATRRSGPPGARRPTGSDPRRRRQRHGQDDDDRQALRATERARAVGDPRRSGHLSRRGGGAARDLGAALQGRLRRLRARGRPGGGRLRRDRGGDGARPRRRHRRHGRPAPHADEPDGRSSRRCVA